LFVAPAVDLVQTQVAVHLGESNMALVGLANVALLVILIWGTGRAVHIAQAHRKVAEESVKATQERLLLSLQAAGGGAWDLDLVRDEAWWSPEMYRLWHVPNGQHVRLENALDLIDPRDREHVMRAVNAAIIGHALYECEFRLRNDGSGERWMASRGRVHYDANGTATRLIGISVDISSRKAAEMLLRRTNEALLRSNVELQRFAHVAAHDLQTPLRGIGSFAELLKLSYHDQLAERGREWLDRILTSTRHLHSLIRDLLEYSSVDARPLEVQAVNMDDVLDRALTLLDTEIRESGCAVTRDALPVVSGELTQLVQVLLNLIGNALKYRSTHDPAVHVSADRTDGAWRISVRDNGIGIEPRHASRIFEMFERLHNAQDYPGTGIGLALCRRVIQRHGGNMWVESEPGKGSTFLFTLPAEA
jgi:signal transduction histidine kinase